MRIRIEDVAAAAGVSMKTVSRVLNREPNVREETRLRVEETVAKMRYRPNPSARSLAGQRSYVVALAYDNPSLNYLMEIQAGVLDACRANHYNLVLAPVTFGGRRSKAEITALVEDSGYDGIVLIPPLTDDKDLLKHLDRHSVRFASISPHDPDGRIGVTLDESAAVRQLMAQLVGLGHRRIAHIKGHPAHGACEWRLAGYRQALHEAEIAYDPALVVEGEFTFDSGVRAANALLDLPDPPTAIFAANDDMAAGVFRVAYERGLSIPRDLSVCGYDDTPIARHIFPALTTVRQPTRDMGRVATQELLNGIRDRDAGHMVRMRYTLELRESIAPPAQLSREAVARRAR